VVVSKALPMLVERRFGSLAAPMQDQSSAYRAGGVWLVGGLTAADTSSPAVLQLRGSRVSAVGSLPTGIHDSAAVALGGSVYLFGGGTSANTQAATIYRISTSGGVSVAGTLPVGSSDQSAAAIGGTAYVVGGYTGSVWLSTIVAWRPGSASRVAAHLPFPLRYAAVAAVDGRLVIAGGSLEDGSASRAILMFSPGKGVTRIGELPAPTTHAAAAAIGRFVYVIGGRGANLDTPTGRIVGIDPQARRTWAAGSLGTPRSDLAAISLGPRILLAGGHGAGTTLSTLSTLAPGVARRVSSARARFALKAGDVYAYDGADMLTPVTRQAKPYVYVPNSESNTVDVIDQRTFKVIDQFPVGFLPQHVVPAWNLRTLYVTNDAGNSLTAINPNTGKPTRTIPVEDPYNMYFTPDGRYALVVAERLRQLDFRNAATFALHKSLPLPCIGPDHMDFSADGSYALVSCEFSGQIVRVAIASERVTGVITLPDGAGGMPQDVKLAPDGEIFYVADMRANGLWEINGATLKVEGFIHTGLGAHGLYPSRNAKFLYVSNRSQGTISVISFRTRRVVHTWTIPGGGSPDMGGVSADGKVLWLSGRYNAVVYAISTTDGRLLAKIPVGAGPHGLCVWPQPGRYSLGHTGILR
jgi:YVTN family beta-propeller protein